MVKTTQKTSRKPKKEAFFRKNDPKKHQKVTKKSTINW